MLGRIIQTLSTLLTAVLVISEGEPDVPLPVHGIVGRSVDLTVPENHTGSGLEIYWTFQTSILAVFTNNDLKIRNVKFRNRLETVDHGTTLRISDLRKDDGGKYTGSIHFTDEKVDEKFYNLTVYDPVPSPSIQTEWGKDPMRCNVTLQCSVPSPTSDLSYSWKSRHQDSTYQPYGNGRTLQISLPPDQRDSTYQPYSNGSTLQISLPPDHRDSTYQPYGNGRSLQISLPLDHQDMELMCIVQNPADQKNVSITVGHGCQHPDTSKDSKGDGRHYYMLLLIPLAVLAGILGLFLFKLYNKKKKAEKKGRKESEEMSEINYAELALRPNSCEQRASPKNEESTQETVYSAVVS